MKRIALVLLVSTLAGCASIPLGTMWRMMHFTPEDFVALDPAQLGVAILLPDEMALNGELVTFNVELFQRQGDKDVLVAHEYARLESVEKGRRVVAPLPDAGPGRHWHVLRLPAASHRTFRHFQATFGDLWRQDNDGDYFNIMVNPKFEEAESLTGVHEITIALRFSEEEGWFDLLRNVELDFDEIRRREQQSN